MPGPMLAVMFGPMLPMSGPVQPVHGAMFDPLFGPMLTMHGSMLDLMSGPMFDPTPRGGGAIIPICCPVVGGPMLVGGPVGGPMLHAYTPMSFCAALACHMPPGGVGHDCTGAPIPALAPLKGVGGPSAKPSGPNLSGGIPERCRHIQLPNMMSP